jgi:hypothetical protein
MAVPKKKRYKEVVKSRRSLDKLNFLKKKNITITKFMNYANISPNYQNVTYCNFCQSTNITNNLCASCYVLYFLNFFSRKNEFRNKKERTRNLELER